MDQHSAQARVTPKTRFGSGSQWKNLLGYMFAAACLLWVFYDIQPRRLWDSMRSIELRWLALAIAFDVASYLVQGWRWQLLLKTIRPIPILRVTQAIYVGLFANAVLPLRVGELIRCFLIASWQKAALSSVLSSIAIERLFDGIWLAAGLGVTALLVPLPRHLAQAADVTGIVMLTALFIFILLVWRAEESAPKASAHAGFLKRHLLRLVEALRAMSRSSGFYTSFAASFLFLATQTLAFWVVMWGYGLHLSLWAGFAVLLIVHLGTAIPNAPANIGSFQFFTVVGLELFGVDKTVATGFSVVAFVILTLPLWAVGFLALTRSGTTLAAIRKDVRGWVNRSRSVEGSPRISAGP